MFLSEADAVRAGLQVAPRRRPRALCPDWRPGFLVQLGGLGVLELHGQPELEYRFHPARLWRFDLAWPRLLVAVEIEGAVWVQGRHSRGRGFEQDARKYAEAAVRGWRLIRVTPGMISTGEAAFYTRDLLDLVQFAAALSKP